MKEKEKKSADRFLFIGSKINRGYQKSDKADIIHATKELEDIGQIDQFSRCPDGGQVK